MSAEDIKRPIEGRRPVEGTPLGRLKHGRLKMVILQFESVSPVEGMSVEDIRRPAKGISIQAR